MPGPRVTGHVKFFSSVKGYGFIIPDSSAVEVFVHYTGIISKAPGFRSLAEGERVEFEVVQGPKGLQAANVSGPDRGPVVGDTRGWRSPVHGRGQMYPSLSMSPPSTPGYMGSPQATYYTPIWDYMPLSPPYVPCYYPPAYIPYPPYPYLDQDAG